MQQVRDKYGVSERHACRVLGQPRTTQRYQPTIADDEELLTATIVHLASQYGRYGYRRITALLRVEGWHVNHKRVERIWRREGLKVPAKQPKRGRLWLNDGSCIRLRPCWRHHVWAYDFVQARTHDGRAFRMLTVIDEFSRECLAIAVAGHLRSDDVLQVLTDLFTRYGAPDYIRSDNGSEFTAKSVRAWLPRVGVKTINLPQTDDLDIKIDDAGLDTLEYNKRSGHYRLRLTKDDIESKSDFLKNLSQLAYDRRTNL